MSTPQQKTVDCNKYSNLVCEDDWVKNLQKFKENLEKGQFYSESTSTGGGITDLNGETGATQTFATGTSGTDFGISSASNTHTFNIPSASASNRGLLTTTDWSAFNAKQAALSLTTTGTSGAATLVGSTLNIPQYAGNPGTVTSIATNSPITGGTITGSGTIGITQATTSTDGYLSSTDFNTFNGKQAALTNPVTGTGTNNEIAYFNATGSSIGSLTTGTYPSLTELSYVKGVTSAVQTQLNGKQGSLTLTTTGSSGAATLIGNTLNIPQYSGGGAVDFYTTGFGLMGSTLKGVSLSNPFIKLPFTIALASGFTYLYAYYLENSYTITGCRWCCTTNGVYTPSNYNGVGLYTYSGGTLTLVASSTNDGSCWSQGLTWKNKAFSSPYSASAGLYFVALLYSSSAQTTAPSLAGFYSEANAAVRNYDLTNSSKTVGVLSGQTSLASSIASSSISGNTNNIGIYLY